MILDFFKKLFPKVVQDRKFWVVIRQDDYRYFRHLNKQLALKEAERLAVHVCPGKTFFVAEVVDGRLVDVEPDEYELLNEDDLPF